jgi:putative heme-binding domain-containing protein
MQCLTCHRVGDQGTDLGPDLSKIGAKLNRTKLLDNLLNPAREMEPKFVPHTVVTTGGQVHTGLLVEKSAKEIVLRDGKNQLVRVAVAEVDQVVPQKNSLMPDGLLRDLTAQQAADLLAYLESLR